MALSWMVLFIGVILGIPICSEYQRFFDMFDRGKQGYIMVTQIGQIMHAMEQDFGENSPSFYQ